MENATTWLLYPLEKAPVPIVQETWWVSDWPGWYGKSLYRSLGGYQTGLDGTENLCTGDLVGIRLAWMVRKVFVQETWWVSDWPGWYGKSLYRRLGGYQTGLDGTENLCTGNLVGIRLAWMVRKILSLLPPHLQSIFEPRTVQPVANRNTDHNIQAAYQHKQQVIIWFKVTLLKTVTNIKLY